ncbi:hypothetical protein RJ639_027652 [Escallonia herrerae]|uniref:NAD-dependent epimerase/dehydratase domain-containing protein n=1 Tax=Escallonia herrerae TaxID=1293975 RepID=A0AA89BFY0_9ASTE|nr:hypothetical protein RJ639_027652 [Escallonia herrerae]
MKVLVTGASGYLGGRLCHALLARGHSVRAFVRPTSVVSSLPPPSHGGALELAYGDVTDYRSLLAACSGCHVILHAAALVEPWLPDPSKFTSVNVGGLRNVLQAFKEIKTVEKIIYTSSFFALGPTDGYIADESQVHPCKLFCTEYEKSKTVADKIALEAALEGVPMVVVYPGVIYGPGKVTAGNIVARLAIHQDLKRHKSGHACSAHRNFDSGSKMFHNNVLIERFNGRLPGYIGYGKDKFSFSHVDDVVDGHIAAMNKGRLGERYLLTGENASFVQVFNTAAIITQTKRPWFNIPLGVIEAYGWASVLFSRITGNLPLISPPVRLTPYLSGELRFSNDLFGAHLEQTVYVLRHQWAYSCEKAKAELDYNPRSLSEGLAEVLPWLKSLGLIKF